VRIRTALTMDGVSEELASSISATVPETAGARRKCRSGSDKSRTLGTYVAVLPLNSEPTRPPPPVIE